MQTLFVNLEVEPCLSHDQETGPDVDVPESKISAPKPRTVRQRAKSALLTLPVEIRGKIFKYLLPHQISNRSIHLLKTHIDYETYNFVSLIRTCAQIHDELAPAVYKQVCLSNEAKNLNLPVEFLHMIGSNVRHIDSARIVYNTERGTFGKGAKFPLPSHRKNWLKFPFIEALRLLQAEATGLRTVHVNMAEFSSEARDRSFFNNEKVIRGIAPEVMYTLRELAHFKNVEKIIFSDEAGKLHFWDPIVLYYLRGQLGFDLRKAHESGLVLQTWFDQTGPRPCLKDRRVKAEMELDILVNPNWAGKTVGRKFVRESCKRDYELEFSEQIKRRWARHMEQQKGRPAKRAIAGHW